MTASSRAACPAQSPYRWNSWPGPDADQPAAAFGPAHDTSGTCWPTADGSAREKSTRDFAAGFSSADTIPVASTIAVVTTQVMSWHRVFKVGLRSVTTLFVTRNVSSDQYKGVVARRRLPCSTAPPRETCEWLARVAGFSNNTVSGIAASRRGPIVLGLIYNAPK